MTEEQIKKEEEKKKDMNKEEEKEPEKEVQKKNDKRYGERQLPMKNTSLYDLIYEQPKTPNIGLDIVLVTRLVKIPAQHSLR